MDVILASLAIYLSHANAADVYGDKVYVWSRAGYGQLAHGLETAFEPTPRSSSVPGDKVKNIMFGYHNMFCQDGDDTVGISFDLSR